MLVKIKKSNPVYIGKINTISKIEDGIVVGLYDKMLDEDNPLAWDWIEEYEEIISPTFANLKEILENNEEVTININGRIFCCDGYSAPENPPDGDIKNWYDPKMRYRIDYQTTTREKFEKLLQMTI